MVGNSQRAIPTAIRTHIVRTPRKINLSIAGQIGAAKLKVPSGHFAVSLWG